MKKNDIIIIDIEDIGIHGEGIGHFEGMAFFVPRALPGDRIKAGITKLTKKIGYARIIEILEPSPDRVPERCSAASKCGGCQLQHLSVEGQLKWKSETVKQDLIRLGGFEESYIDSVMEPIIGMDEPFRYRNKAQFPVGLDNEGNIITGFYAGRSHRIIPVHDCMLGIPENKDITDAVISFMNDFNIRPYDETNGTGIVRHILTRYGRKSRELMICLIINCDRLPHEEEFVLRMREIFEKEKSGQDLASSDNAADNQGLILKSVSININKRRDNVILGNKTRTLWGQDTIRDTIGDVTFKISPQSFYQVNPEQTEKLYGKALEYADLTGNETVWDLYCGIGTISLFLARKAKTVYGVEIVEQAVRDAAENAALNHIDNAHFIAGKAEEILPLFYSDKGKEILGKFTGMGQNASGIISGESASSIPEGNDKNSRNIMLDEIEKAKTPDVIVVDPPRKGLDSACIDTMLRMSPKRIVYVSCNPSTLARDLRLLCDGGYTLNAVTPVDQFGNTCHVEVVVMLSRA